MYHPWTRAYIPPSPSPAPLTCPWAHGFPAPVEGSPPPALALWSGVRLPKPHPKPHDRGGERGTQPTESPPQGEAGGSYVGEEVCGSGSGRGREGEGEGRGGGLSALYQVCVLRVRHRAVGKRDPIAGQTLSLLLDMESCSTARTLTLKNWSTSHLRGHDLQPDRSIRHLSVSPNNTWLQGETTRLHCTTSTTSRVPPTRDA